MPGSVGGLCHRYCLRFVRLHLACSASAARRAVRAAGALRLPLMTVHAA